MKTIRTILREDFGRLDRNLVRSELLSERGVKDVHFETARNGLSIEYDPAVINDSKLLEIMCRYGVFPEARSPRPNGPNESRETAMANPSNEWTETLKDGRRVLIRPIRRDDVDRNAAFLDELSPPSRHFLFLAGIARLSDEALQRLCDPDYAHDMAYVALELDGRGGEPQHQVGVCRYAGANSAQGAEISVAVADDWQHQGLGKRILAHLIDYARSHGVTRLYSMDSLGNRRMRKLAGHLGFTERPDPNDSSQVIFHLDLGAANVSGGATPPRSGKRPAERM